MNLLLLLLLIIFLLLLKLLLYLLLLKIGVRTGLPGWQLGQLIYGGFGLFYEPIHGFAGAVVAEPVLHVVELNGGVGGQADSTVPGTFGCADLAVPVFPPGGPDNVAALNFYYLPTGGGPQAQSRRRWLMVVVPHFFAQYMFDVLPQ